VLSGLNIFGEILIFFSCGSGPGGTQPGFFNGFFFRLRAILLQDSNLGRRAMPAFEFDNKKIYLDEEGYLENFEDWDETVACALAEKEGVGKECPLGEQQIEILRFIREYYKKFGSVPVVRAVCTNVHQPRECEYIQFPDPVTACKIAGIPKLNTGYELM
jgi:TusE/DsrC/DsvC family sulfur relay protein